MSILPGDTKMIFLILNQQEILCLGIVPDPIVVGIVAIDFIVEDLEDIRFGDILDLLELEDIFVVDFGCKSKGP